MYGICIWVLELQGLKMGFLSAQPFLSLHYFSILAHCALPLISLLESEEKMTWTKFLVLWSTFDQFRQSFSSFSLILKIFLFAYIALKSKLNRPKIEWDNDKLHLILSSDFESLIMNTLIISKWFNWLVISRTINQNAMYFFFGLDFSLPIQSQSALPCTPCQKTKSNIWDCGGNFFLV